MAYRNQYSLTEIARIELLIAKGKPYSEIAKALGRSRSAIVNFCYRNEMRSNFPAESKTRWKRPYTEAELHKLRRWAPHHSISELALLLNRSVGSISGTCAYYGIKTNGGKGGGCRTRRVPMQAAGLQPTHGLRAEM